MGAGEQPEQIERHGESPGYKRELKKRMKRARRRLEKKKLDDAPKKDRFGGYSM